MVVWHLCQQTFLGRRDGLAITKNGGALEGRGVGALVCVALAFRRDGGGEGRWVGRQQ